jgi:hypothetical protein
MRVFCARIHATVAQRLLQRHHGNGQPEIHWVIVIERGAENLFCRPLKDPGEKTDPRAHVRENVIENSERTRTTNTDLSGRVSATKYRGHFQQSARKEDDEKDSCLL